MSDNDERHDVHVEVPAGSLSLDSEKPTVWTAIQYYRQHRWWMLLAVTLIVLPPIIGYAISGVWSIVFGLMSGAAGFYAGSKALIKIIERRGG